VRREFFDVHKANGSPIAREALERIGALFDSHRAARPESRVEDGDLLLGAPRSPAPNPADHLRQSGHYRP
jgi:hypothetical protein